MAITQIPLLSLIGEFPTRKLPQNRFDETVKANMSQLSLFTKEMDEQVIPALNSLTTEVQNNANAATTSATNARSFNFFNIFFYFFQN